MKKEKDKKNLRLIIDNAQVRRLLSFTLKNRRWILVFAIFGLEVFLRFSQIDTKNPFGYDQVDFAWTAKNIIINHRFPLVGMIAKQNTGFYVGPLYYYFVAIFYWITRLSPIASPMIAGVTSIFTFWVLIFVTKKLFSYTTAVIAVFIQTVSYHAIIFDRVQWSVNFIPALSLLILYFLYKVIMDDVKYLPILFVLIGLMFHIHFTAIFFIPLVLLVLPFFPRTKKTLLYLLISLTILFIFFIPNILFELQHSSSQSSHISNYLHTYYHGFHLTRVLQIAGDGFIQFNPFLFFPNVIFVKFFLLPLFVILYLSQSSTKRRLLLCYLFVLWFIVPWMVFTTYRGEISDYYFSINRFVALSIIAYILFWVWEKKHIAIRASILILLGVYTFYNLTAYMHYEDVGLQKRTKDAQKEINEGRIIQYQQGVPDAYFYYYLMRQAHKHVSYE